MRRLGGFLLMIPFLLIVAGSVAYVRVVDPDFIEYVLEIFAKAAVVVVFLLIVSFGGAGMLAMYRNGFKMVAKKGNKR